MNYNYNNLKGSVLLRADSHSQKTEIDMGYSKKELISEEQFWGNEHYEGLYYNYESEENKYGYTVASEGWNDYSSKPTEKMSIIKTKLWINNKIFLYNEKNLCVIQGYAGCGKTTFVQGILRELYAQKVYSNYYNFYIGHVKNSKEDQFIFSSIMTKLISQITCTLQEADGMTVYDKFVELFEQDLSTLSPTLDTYFSSLFNCKNDASLYQYARNVFDNKDTNDIEMSITKFRVQFKQAYLFREGKLSLHKYKNCEDNNSLEIILFIDFLWRCAIYMVRSESSISNQIVVYDNLDIIDNQHIVADFIDTLRSVLSNYSAFRNLCSIDMYLPTFKVIIVVRKITYAPISRFVEVGYNEIGQTPPDADFLDISNLYIPSNILKHKAKILRKYIDSYIPEDAKCRDEILYFLEEVLKVPNELFADIKFGELLNHNIRACTNMMEQVIESYVYRKYIFNSDTNGLKMSDNCKSSVWIHIICTILKEKKVWNNLGYNLSNSERLSYPTTLSRLILTYLCNRRLGCMRDERGFNSSDVSFKEIVQTLEKIPFGIFDRRNNWEKDIIFHLESEYKQADSQKKIVDHITSMLQRNEIVEESELWRRPIYYTHNAFLLTDSNSIKNELINQINNFCEENANTTSFCITDEGYTFIEKIATHFEFYSVRYNNTLAEPVCCILDADKLDKIISGVYKQVEQCAIKQIWIMQFFMKKYNVSKNLYLNEWFHPRTEHFQPQLHIVRTIYDHISYLDDYREYLHKNYTENHELLNSLNHCLVKWIGKYLHLYKEYFFNELKATDGEYNNNVWLDLKYLYWIIFKDENKKGIYLNGKDILVAIKRINSAISRDKQNNIGYNAEYKIADEELLKKPMLLED